MSKIKLILSKAIDPKKIEVAGYFASIKIGTAVALGEELHIEANSPGPDNLVKFGRLLETVKGNELDAVKKAAADKAAKKAA